MAPSRSYPILVAALAFACGSEGDDTDSNSMTVGSGSTTTSSTVTGSNTGAATTGSNTGAATTGSNTGAATTGGAGGGGSMGAGGGGSMGAGGGGSMGAGGGGSMGAGGAGGGDMMGAGGGDAMGAGGGDAMDDDMMTDDMMTDDMMTDDMMADDMMADDMMTDDMMTDDMMADDMMTDDMMTDDMMTDDMMTDDSAQSGECMKGTTAANEVVFIGESFIAASSIARDTSNLAAENGSLQQGEQYLDFSVSGTRLGDGAIPSQYTQAQAANPIRFVLMNGGGNDCLQANDPNAPIPAVNSLYEQMAADGVEKVVYFFYPDAAGGFGGPGSSLQTCLEEYRPKIKEVCDGLTSPECHWLDLAETEWDGNEDAFTTDGIHPNGEGSRVTAEAIWQTMVDNCVAQ